MERAFSALYLRKGDTWQGQLHKMGQDAERQLDDGCVARFQCGSQMQQQRVEHGCHFGCPSTQAALLQAAHQQAERKLQQQMVVPRCSRRFQLLPIDGCRATNSSLSDSLLPPQALPFPSGSNLGACNVPTFTEMIMPGLEHVPWLHNAEDCGRMREHLSIEMG